MKIRVKVLLCICLTVFCIRLELQNANTHTHTQLPLESNRKLACAEYCENIIYVQTAICVLYYTVLITNILY